MQGVRKIGNLALKMFAALVLRAMAWELAEKEIERVSPRDRGVSSRYSTGTLPVLLFCPLVGPSPPSFIGK